MKSNLYLGKYFGTKIEIHWTFYLLTVWIILSEYLNGGSIDRILFNFQFIVAVMICVLLHELGHAWAAKKFGIKTTKMVLLPIGGISSINKTIESPKAEFLITIAGPLVNVIIAIVLFFTIPVNDFVSYNLGEYFSALNDFSVRTFLFFLFIVNVALVIFNMIPAFPLDGGRILRATLDLSLDRVRATSVTATIGHIIALIFFLAGLLFNPLLVFLSLFLFIGGYSENKMVSQLGLVKGHKVRDAMLENITVFDPEDTMEKVVKAIITGTETNFIIIKNHEVVGLLYHKSIIENSHLRTLQLKELMTTKFKTIQVEEKLSAAYGLIEHEFHTFFPVMDKDKLVGAIDLINLHEFLLMEAKLQY